MENKTKKLVFSPRIKEKQEARLKGWVRSWRMQ